MKTISPATRQSKSITAIVKPTTDCNLNCIYCYEDKSRHQKICMDHNTLKHVIVKFVEYNGTYKETQFIWHGGEPLLMGRTFFDRIVEIQKELTSSFRIRNGVQTNGTLLTKDFINFFKEWEFSVGISVDGPKWLHNTQRPYIDGQGSFDNLFMDKIKILMEPTNRQKNGRPTCSGAIAILTKNSLVNLDEIYDFFSSNKINLKINPIFYEGNGKMIRKKLGITPKEYGDAMIHLFNRWFFEEGPSITIEPFFEILGNLIVGRPQGCLFTGTCYTEYLEVAPNGDVYPCCGKNSRSSSLGNINKDDMNDILDSPVLDQLKVKRAEAMMRCSNCDYVSICNAGCVRRAYSRRRNFTDRDYYCLGYKVLFNYIHKTLAQELGAGYKDYFKENVVISKIHHPILKKVFTSRIYQSNINTWMDKDWMQWRGDHSDWNAWKGDWDDLGGCP